ncbi:MAG: DUF4367 domain-containing protein [Firmicutes bacterium]|nr:DUF4367 domain-containing protein [Bacillota bacterium]
MIFTDEELSQAANTSCQNWSASYPSAIPEHIFSPTFEEKMDKLLRTPYRRPKFKTLLIATAAAAMLILTSTAAVLPPAKDFRTGFIEIIRQIWTKSTDQNYTATEDHEGKTLRPALSYLPEGMIETDRTALTNSTLISFENKDGYWLTISAKRITEGSGNQFSFDSEGADVCDISINGQPATLVIENNRTLLIFFIDNYSCAVSGTISTEEIIKISECLSLEF